MDDDFLECPRTPGTDLTEGIDEVSQVDSQTGNSPIRQSKTATSSFSSTGDNDGLIAVGTGSISSQQLATTLFEDRLQHCVVMHHVMPWETGAFGQIFGECDNIFPRIQTPDVPVGVEDGGNSASSAPVPFEQRTVSIHVRAVSFGSFKTKRYG